MGDVASLPQAGLYPDTLLAFEIHTRLADASGVRVEDVSGSSRCKMPRSSNHPWFLLAFEWPGLGCGSSELCPDVGDF